MKKILLAFITFCITLNLSAQIPEIYQTQYPTYLMLKQDYGAFSKADSTAFSILAGDSIVSYFTSEGNNYVVGAEQFYAEGIGFHIRAYNSDDEDVIDGVPVGDTIRFALNRGTTYYRIFTDSLFKLSGTTADTNFYLIADGLSVTYTKKIYVEATELTGLLAVPAISSQTVLCPIFTQMDSDYHDGNVQYSYGDTIQMDSVYMSRVDTITVVVGTDTAFRYYLTNRGGFYAEPPTIIEKAGWGYSELSTDGYISGIMGNYNYLTYHFGQSDFDNEYVLFKYTAIKNVGCEDTDDAVVYQKYNLINATLPDFTLPTIDTLNFWYLVNDYFTFTATYDSISVVTTDAYYPHYLLVQYQSGASSYTDIDYATNSDSTCDVAYEIPSAADNSYDKIKITLYSYPDSLYVASRTVAIPPAPLADESTLTQLEYSNLITSYDYLSFTYSLTDSTIVVSSKLQFYSFTAQMSYSDAGAVTVFYDQTFTSGVLPYDENAPSYLGRIRVDIPEYVLTNEIQYVYVKIISPATGYYKYIPINLFMFYQ